MIGETIGGYGPLFKDGTPVRIGDRVEAHAEPMEVMAVEVCPRTTLVYGHGNAVRLSPGERVSHEERVAREVDMIRRYEEEYDDE